MNSAELLYTWKIGQNNLIIPSFKVTQNDRDGDARDYIETEVKVGHLYFDKTWFIASNIFVGQSQYDKENPIFQKKQDMTSVGGGVNVTYQKPFGWKDWNLNGGIIAAQSNSDIEFYDSSLLIVSFGMAYVF